MLILRRKAGESILIGSDIEVQVVEVTPTRVKLGIVAPAEVSVLRKEIQLTLEANRAAAGGLAPDIISALVRKLRRTPPAPTGAAPESSPQKP